VRVTRRAMSEVVVLCTCRMMAQTCRLPNPNQDQPDGGSLPGAEARGTTSAWDPPVMEQNDPHHCVCSEVVGGTVSGIC
jgi:hypothetical protein